MTIPNNNLKDKHNEKIAKYRYLDLEDRKHADNTVLNTIISTRGVIPKNLQENFKRLYRNISSRPDPNNTDNNKQIDILFLNISR